MNPDGDQADNDQGNNDRTDQSRENEPAGSGSLAGRLVAGGARRAQRAVGATGIDQALETTIEDALVRAVESEATERAVGRILNGPVIEQAVQEALRSEAVEQAILEVVDSELVDRLWGRILDSGETQRLIERIAEAPEVRAAIASQGVGLIGDIGKEVSKVTRIADFLLERVFRRILFRRRRTAPTDRAGLGTRALALAIDAFLINVGLFAATWVVGLLAAFLGLDPNGAPTWVLTLGAASWFGMSSLYFFIFWSISGQTPGMRFLDVRIERNGSNRLGARAALRRLIGFWLAVIPFGLGFIGVLLRLDRRGFHDRLGGTAVFYVDGSEPDEPHLAPILDPHLSFREPVDSAARPATGGVRASQRYREEVP